MHVPPADTLPSGRKRNRDNFLPSISLPSITFYLHLPGTARQRAEIIRKLQASFASGTFLFALHVYLNSHLFFSPPHRSITITPPLLSLPLFLSLRHPGAESLWRALSVSRKQGSGYC